MAAQLETTRGGSSVADLVPPIMKTPFCQIASPRSPSEGSLPRQRFLQLRELGFMTFYVRVVRVSPTDVFKFIDKRSINEPPQGNTDLRAGDECMLQRLYT